RNSAPIEIQPSKSVMMRSRVMRRDSQRAMSCSVTPRTTGSGATSSVATGTACPSVTAASGFSGVDIIMLSTMRSGPSFAEGIGMTATFARAMLPIVRSLLSDVDGSECLGVGGELAAVLGGIGLGVLFQQERHHARVLGVRLDRVKRGVGEHLDAELV